MSQFITLPSSIGRKNNLSLLIDREIEEDRKREVAHIEKSMRLLFFGERINPSIVDQYNELEKRWKQLTGYKTK